MDHRIEKLVASYLDGGLGEQDERRLARHLAEHEADRKEFLALAAQARTLGVLLSRRRDLVASVLAELRARANGGRFLGQVLARLRRRRLRWPIVAAAAAALLLAVTAAIWLIRPRGPSDDPSPPTPPAPVAARWHVQPTGGAVYRMLEPGRLRLERGEILVESAPATKAGGGKGALYVETPAGAAVATGTRFYIGTHTREPQRKGSTMNRLTRVLVLAGVVTLTNPFGSVTGRANDLLAAETGAAPIKLAVRAGSNFGLDLYAQLAKENAGKSLFFSPYSISSALAMTAEGARGRTAAEMGKVLGFPAAARRVGPDAQEIPWRTSLIHTGMAELNARLSGKKDAAAEKSIRAEIAKLRAAYEAAQAKSAQLRKERKWAEWRQATQAENRIAAKLSAAASQVDQYEIRVANALWGEKTYPFLDAYINTINKHYKTGGVFPADFKNDFPTERARINEWVEQQTNRRIKDLIPEIPPGQARLISLILTNAIYFKGDWAMPFKESRTRPLEFTLAGGEKIKTPTMSAYNLQVGRYAAFNADGSYFETPLKIERTRRTGLYPGEGGFAMLELPYKGGDLSMVLIVPTEADGLGGVEKKLTVANLTAWIAKLAKRKVNVFLPKFRLETDYKMAKTLKAMGMVRAFIAPGPGGADFTGMCASSDPGKRLYISKVLHKAFVEVNEKGTEAAAATAVIMTRKGGVPPVRPFTPTFKADRPFVFLIRDGKTGSILFLGRMTNPQAK